LWKKCFFRGDCKGGFVLLASDKRAEGGDDRDIPLDQKGTRNTNTIVTTCDYFSSFFFSPCMYKLFSSFSQLDIVLSTPLLIKIDLRILHESNMPNRDLDREILVV